MLTSTITCYFCNTTVPNARVAIEAGWIPSFWFNEKEESSEPVCASCADLHLTFDEDGPMLKAERSNWTGQAGQTSQPSERTGD